VKNNGSRQSGSDRSGMRLLLWEHGIPGGIETVNIRLVKEFIELVDLVVWVMPHHRLEYFQRLLPPSDRLVYEPRFWSRQSRLNESLNSTQKFVVQRKASLDPALRKVRSVLVDLRLNWIIRRYRLTHSLCSWLHVDVPRIRIPTGVMVMDVMWKHFPDSFGQGSQESVDRRFIEWVEKAALLFPVSNATAREIERFYPEYRGSMRVVPHGTLPHQPNERSSAVAGDSPDHRPTFYYPARAGINKDHLTLFRACEQLYAEGHDFDVILTGHQIEHFIDSDYDNDNGIGICRGFLREKENLFRSRIKPLGYGPRSDVEAFYKSCTAVVLPSAFEGFGLPLVEALENGAEIICSDIAPYREQLLRYGCADQVAVFPAGDSCALAANMHKFLVASRQPARRKRSRSIMLENWTWRDAAAAYVESLSAFTRSQRIRRLSRTTAGPKT
jgi:glycosyltransferase involved in cell wall biosynthesis